MTVREAVELVIQAGSIGAVEQDGSGNIYVLDMGKPVRILDLAQQMIRLAGLEPEKDIALTFTGLRPGEKLQEELFASSEKSSTTQHDSLLLAEAPREALKALTQHLPQLRDACTARRTQEAINVLKRLVPELENRHQETGIRDQKSA